jgi:hypothetical protein
MVGTAAQPPGTRFHNQTNEITIDAKHVVHITQSMVKSVRGISVLVWAETSAKTKRRAIVNAVFIKLLFSFFYKRRRLALLQPLIIAIWGKQERV